MSEEFEPKETASSLAQNDSENTVAILNDIQQKPFGKSGRPFNWFNRNRSESRGNEFRQEGFSSQSSGARHFDKPRGEERHDFGGKKKKFFHRGKRPR